MKINIYCENIKLSKDYEDAISEYVKRCSAYSKINFFKFTDNCLKDTDYTILIDKTSDLISSDELADKIRHITNYESSTINFVILSKNISSYNIENFNESFALSKINISENLLLILLSEQIYRAFTIINGKKYHK